MAEFGAGHGCKVPNGAGAERMVGIAPEPGRSSENGQVPELADGFSFMPRMVWKQEPNKLARLETDPVDWMGLVHHSLVTLDSDQQIEGRKSWGHGWTKTRSHPSWLNAIHIRNTTLRLQFYHSLFMQIVSWRYRCVTPVLHNISIGGYSFIVNS